MKKKKVLASTIIIALVIVAALIGWYISTPPSAPPRATRGGTVTLALPADVSVVDPCCTTNDPDQEVDIHVVEGLMYVDPITSQPLPKLALSYQVSQDGLLYTFNLRKGVKFQDGTPFNSSVVRFNIDRVRKPPAIYPQFVRDITEVELVDDYTVRLHLGQPVALMLAYLAHPYTAMQSPTAIMKWGDQYYKHLTGTGPFRLVNIVPGTVTELAAFEGYWGGMPSLDKIRFVPITDASVRESAVITGDVDIAPNVQPQSVPRFTNNSDITLNHNSGVRVQYVQLNTVNPPFNDTRVRQAVSYAIDRASIVKNILGGFGVVADGPIARHANGYVPSGYDYPGKYEYNPSKARDLLRQAGYPNGFETNLITQPGRYMMDVPAMEAIQSYLAAVGIKAQIVQYDGATWAAYAANKANKYKFGMIENAWAPATGDGAQILFTIYVSDSSPDKGGSANWAYYNSPKFDSIAQLSQRANSTQQRLAILKQAYDLLIEDAPSVNLYEIDKMTAIRNRVHGVVIPVQSYFAQLNNASIVETKRSPSASMFKPLHSMLEPLFLLGTLVASTSRLATLGAVRVGYVLSVVTKSEAKEQPMRLLIPFF